MLEYSPPSRGIFVNIIRSVSEPYIRGVTPSLIKERGHSLYSPTVEPTVRYCSPSHGTEWEGSRFTVLLGSAESIFPTQNFSIQCSFCPLLFNWNHCKWCKAHCMPCLCVYQKGCVPGHITKCHPITDPQRKISISFVLFVFKSMTFHLICIK